VRPDGDEHDLGLADGSRVGREGQAPDLTIGLDELGQAGLMEWHPAIEKRLDAGRRNLDAHDIVALLRKAG
jgi:hypothetical protein